MANAEKFLRYSLYAVLGIYFVNFVVLGFLIGPYDYNHLSGYYELAWRFWRIGGGGLPQYNPFICGGRTLGADPQLPVFHPLVLLVPILGATWTIKLEMLTQLGLGAYCLWKWLELLGASNEGRRWGVFLFISGGAVVTRFMVGHVTLGFYLLSPAFFYFSYALSVAQGQKFKRLLFWYFLLFWYCGWYKPNFMIYFIPPLMFEHALRSLSLKKPRIFLWGLAAAVFGLLSTTVCWLPAWKLFSDAPRGDGVPFNHTPFYGLLANLLLPLKAIPFAFYGDNSFTPRHEFNLFIGPIGIILAGVGVWRVFKLPTPQRRLLAPLAILMIVSAWLGMGIPTASWFGELHHQVLKFWPGFSSIRVPPRFWFAIYLGAIVFSSLGWWTPEPPRWRKAWLVLATLPLLLTAAVNLSKTTVLADQNQWSSRRHYADYVFWKETEPDNSFQELHQGFGALRCVYNIEIFQSPDVTVGSALNVISTQPVKFSAHWRSWNRIVFHAEGSVSSILKLNLNHSPAWRVEGEGAKIVSQRSQRLALTLLNSTADGELIYEQPLEGIAAAVTFAALVFFSLFSGFYLWKRET